MATDRRRLGGWVRLCLTPAMAMLALLGSTLSQAHGDGRGKDDKGWNRGGGHSAVEPDGPCTQRFPIYSTSRIVAGAPIEGGIYKCALKPVERAVREGLYQPWTLTTQQVQRLKQIFPDGVCDYSRPDQGRPRQWPH